MEKKSFFVRGFLRFAVIFAVLALVVPGSAFALESQHYREGFLFGKNYRNEVMGNIAELQNKSAENDLDSETLLGYAKETEALYLSVLPGKTEWMKGVADGSGIAYEDILIFNVADRTITGFVGECTTFAANGKAVKGGGTIIAKNRDLGFQTLIEIGLHQAATHPKGAVYKAAYIDIPQADSTYKFIGSRTAGRWGYGMGINEHQVAVADNDAPSRDRLEFKAGLHDNDLVRIVLERARTAREGVDVIASIVAEYGQAWNGIIFEVGDPEELWVVEITGRRWAAKKYADTATARSNQYQIKDDYDLAASDLVSFAVSQGWAEEGAKKIDFRKVYATDELYPSDNDLAKRKTVETMYNTEMRYRRAMELLAARQGDLTPQAVATMCRDHFDTYTLPDGKTIDMEQVPFYSSKYADWEGFEWYKTAPEKDTVPVHMYVRGPCSHDLGWGTTSSSAILVSRPGVYDELGLMLHAFGPPCNSAYVPFYAGIREVDYRYATPEAALAFQSIMTRAFSKYTLYHDPIRKAFGPYEARLFEELPGIEAKFEEMKKAGKGDEAAGMLTKEVAGYCMEAFRLVDTAHDYMTQAIYNKNRWSR